MAPCIWKVVETSLETRETAIWCFHFLLSRLAKFLKTEQTCCWGCREKAAPSRCWLEGKLAYNLLGGQGEASAHSPHISPRPATPQGPPCPRIEGLSGDMFLPSCLSLCFNFLCWKLHLVLLYFTPHSCVRNSHSAGTWLKLKNKDLKA